MAERPTVTIEELRLIQEQEKKKKPAGMADDQVSDYAVAALAAMRGLTRSDKLKVLRRMQRMLGATTTRRSA
jgi:hypothetical protein